MAARWNNIKTK